MQNRLMELLLKDSEVLDSELEKDIYWASFYLANVTLDSLDQMFTNANRIKEWLGNMAQLVAKQGQSMAWITPLGLPCIQPYRQDAHYVIKTVLQNMVLTLNNDLVPVSSRKQKTAFPPNFVHSLDATHMLLTCLKMKERGKTFAAVHDSYWTHPSDVEEMAEVK